MPALEPRDPGPRHPSGSGPTNPPPAPRPHSGPTGPRPSAGPSRRPSAAAPPDRPSVPLRSVATVRLGDLPHRFRAKLLEPEDLGPEPEPVPDPFEDVDSLEEMEEKIIFEAVHHHAGVYRLLVWVGEFVRRRGWELHGHRTPAHWLHFITSFDLGTCREKIRVARALPDLPLIAAAMAKGELSFAKVRALTRAADPENEADLLEVARDATTAQLERYVRALNKNARVSEAAQERSNHRHRRFRIWPDEGGMYKVEGRVTPEVGALLMRAIEAGMDAMFCEEAREETTPVQRRADALGLVAERALAAGFGAEPDEEAEEGGESVSAEPSGPGREAEGEQGHVPRDGRAEHGPTFLTHSHIPAPDDSPESQPTRIRSTRPERYQVFLHVDYETVRKHGEGEKCHLEDGTRVSAETCRRLTCDCSLVKVLRNENGDVLNVGRRTRSIPPAIRRAVEIRDQGCRWPGCGLRFTVPHHVHHWADGGETRLGNLLSLCHFHHRKVHEDGWDVVYNAKDDTAVFWGPAGQVRAHRPPALGVKPEVAARRLIAQNRRQGVDPKGPICSARGFWEEKAPWEREVQSEGEVR